MTAPVDACLLVPVMSPESSTLPHSQVFPGEGSPKLTSPLRNVKAEESSKYAYYFKIPPLDFSYCVHQALGRDRMTHSNEVIVRPVSKGIFLQGVSRYREITR